MLPADYRGSAHLLLISFHNDSRHYGLKVGARAIQLIHLRCSQAGIRDRRVPLHCRRPGKHVYTLH